jgi:hypothetical protein
MRSGNEMGTGSESATADATAADRRKYSPTSKDRIHVTGVGLQFPDNVIAFDEWQQAGRKIARAASSAAWYLGDWLTYGEFQYADRYRTVIDTVGVSYQTLRNYAWVARRFALSRRRDRLTFYHHMEVARLPEEDQDHWLDQAIEHNWSVHSLRRQLRRMREDGEEKENTKAVLPRIDADQERLDRWRAAAEQASTSLANWVVFSLDLAARRVLDDD